MILRRLRRMRERRKGRKIKENQYYCVGDSSHNFICNTVREVEKLIESVIYIVTAGYDISLERKSNEESNSLY